MYAERIDDEAFVNLFRPDQKFESDRRVEEAEDPDDVSDQISPDDVILSVPAVDVASDIPPVVPSIVRADVDVVAVPATVVVDR